MKSQLLMLFAIASIFALPQKWYAENVISQNYQNCLSSNCKSTPSTKDETIDMDKYSKCIDNKAQYKFIFSLPFLPNWRKQSVESCEGESFIDSSFFKAYKNCEHNCFSSTKSSYLSNKEIDNANVVYQCLNINNQIGQNSKDGDSLLQDCIKQQTECANYNQQFTISTFQPCLKKCIQVILKSSTNAYQTYLYTLDTCVEKQVSSSTPTSSIEPLKDTKQTTDFKQCMSSKCQQLKYDGDNDDISYDDCAKSQIKCVYRFQMPFLPTMGNYCQRRCDNLLINTKYQDCGKSCLDSIINQYPLSNTWESESFYYCIESNYNSFFATSKSMAADSQKFQDCVQKESTCQDYLKQLDFKLFRDCLEVCMDDTHVYSDQQFKSFLEAQKTCLGEKYEPIEISSSSSSSNSGKLIIMIIGFGFLAELIFVIAFIIYRSRVMKQRRKELDLQIVKYNKDIDYLVQQKQQQILV